MIFCHRSLNWLTAAFVIGGVGQAIAQSAPLTGSAAFGDWRSDKPGLSRLIKPEDLPKPATPPPPMSRMWLRVRRRRCRKCLPASRSHYSPKA